MRAGNKKKLAEIEREPEVKQEKTNKKRPKEVKMREKLGRVGSKPFEVTEASFAFATHSSSSWGTQVVPRLDELYIPSWVSTPGSPTCQTRPEHLQRGSKLFPGSLCSTQPPCGGNSMSHSFHHYPKLATTGEGWNVNGKS